MTQEYSTTFHPTQSAAPSAAMSDAPTLSYAVDHRSPSDLLEYPEGYHCKKCENTGFKLRDGKSCRKCFLKFAHQDSDVVVHSPPIRRSVTNGHGNKYLRAVMKVVDPPPYAVPVMASFGKKGPYTVTPGDPVIGGVTCGGCRGAGVVLVDLVYEATCKACLGLGRLI